MDGHIYIITGLEIKFRSTRVECEIKHDLTTFAQSSFLSFCNETMKGHTRQCGTIKKFIRANNKAHNYKDEV